MLLAETDLYPPIKTFLEGQGYAVKGEIGRCDVVAVRGDEDPVVVEMKTRFSLDLVFQAVERFSLTDRVYVAIEHRPKSMWTRRSKPSRSSRPASARIAASVIWARARTTSKASPILMRIVSSRGV